MPQVVDVNCVNDSGHEHKSHRRSLRHWIAIDRESDPSAIASVDDAVNNRQLPQTSTILPLLGLIGLGSLVAGFFARH